MAPTLLLAGLHASFSSRNCRGFKGTVRAHQCLQPGECCPAPRRTLCHYSTASWWCRPRDRFLAIGSAWLVASWGKLWRAPRKSVNSRDMTPRPTTARQQQVGYSHGGSAKRQIALSSSIAIQDDFCHKILAQLLRHCQQLPVYAARAARGCAGPEAVAGAAFCWGMERGPAWIISPRRSSRASGALSRVRGLDSR